MVVLVAGVEIPGVPGTLAAPIPDPVAPASTHVVEPLPARLVSGTEPGGQLTPVLPVVPAVPAPLFSPAPALSEPPGMVVLGSVPGVVLGTVPGKVLGSVAGAAFETDPGKLFGTVPGAPLTVPGNDPGTEPGEFVVPGRSVLGPRPGVC